MDIKCKTKKRFLLQNLPACGQSKFPIQSLEFARSDPRAKSKLCAPPDVVQKQVQTQKAREKKYNETMLTTIFTKVYDDSDDKYF